ncbi:hypothetical protein [Streptomyces flaveolus]
MGLRCRELAGAPTHRRGQTNQEDDIVQENFSRAGVYIMGRQVFTEGQVG